eukprot:15113534-Heterocapsa_arctica.AAC.1
MVADGESAESLKVLNLLKIEELETNVLALSSKAKDAEIRAQLLIAAQVKDQNNFERLEFDLEIANVILEKATAANDELQFTINRRPTP